MNDAPLAGRTVLLTRPLGRAGALARRLEALGARVLLRPTIAFAEPSDPGPARDAVQALESYALVAFTSPTGVTFFERHLRTERPGTARPRAIAAVGPGTARSLAALGWDADVVATDPRAEGLVAALATMPLAGCRVLVVRPESGARDLLPAKLRNAGAIVDATPFYRTVPSATAPEAATAIVRGDVDAVVFTSPSTLRCLLDADPFPGSELREGLAGVVRVAIGTVTAAALRESGLPPTAIASRPTADAIVAVLLDALRPESGLC